MSGMINRRRGDCLGTRATAIAMSLKAGRFEALG